MGQTTNVLHFRTVDIIMCMTVSDMYCGVSSERVGHSGKAHGGQEDDSPARGRLSGQGEVETRKGRGWSLTSWMLQLSLIH